MITSPKRVCLHSCASTQGKAERRFASGFQALFAYTFSKNMGIAGNINSDGAPRLHLPSHFHLNYAVTNLNIPHNFQFSGIYELPFGKERKFATSGPASWFLGGWQINSLLSAMSGQPFSITAPGADLNAPGNAQRADFLLPEVRKVGGAGPGQGRFGSPASVRPAGTFSRGPVALSGVQLTLATDRAHPGRESLGLDSVEIDHTFFCKLPPPWSGNRSTGS